MEIWLDDYGEPNFCSYRLTRLNLWGKTASAVEGAICNSKSRQILLYCVLLQSPTATYILIVVIIPSTPITKHSGANALWCGKGTGGQQQIRIFGNCFKHFCTSFLICLFLLRCLFTISLQKSIINRYGFSGIVSNTFESLLLSNDSFTVDVVCL